MGRHRGERLAPALVLGAAAVTIPVASEWAFGHTQVTIAPVVHFYAVGMTALGTAVAALALTWIGAHFNDARTVLIGTAFAVMAALLALHGISTPGLPVPAVRLRRGDAHRRRDAPGGSRDPRALVAAPAVRRAASSRCSCCRAPCSRAILALGLSGSFDPSLAPDGAGREQPRGAVRPRRGPRPLRAPRLARAPDVSCSRGARPT